MKPQHLSSNFMLYGSKMLFPIVIKNYRTVAFSPELFWNSLPIFNLKAFSMTNLNCIKFKSSLFIDYNHINCQKQMQLQTPISCRAVLKIFIFNFQISWYPTKMGIRVENKWNFVIFGFINFRWSAEQSQIRETFENFPSLLL